MTSSEGSSAKKMRVDIGATVSANAISSDTLLVPTGAKKLTEVEDCAVEGGNPETLRLLSTNALPPYNPGTVPSMLSNSGSVEIHCCSDCGDMFFCKSSLTFHVQRRSVLIRFNCDSCKHMQMFFNRCSLLSHIRGHNDKNEPSYISKASISPLPKVLMDGIKSDVMKNLEDEDENNDLRDENSIDPMKVLEVSMTEDEDSSNPHHLLQGESVSQESIHSSVETVPQLQNSLGSTTETFRKFRCSECDKELNSADDRRDHFINGDKVPVMISMCSKCGILCPTECSFRAHKRLHLQVSPYVCPECGNNPDRYWETFQKHLKFQCFHYSRSVGYKCVLCKRLCHSADLLRHHFNKDHTEVLYKCQICPMAFTAFANFHSHRRKTHCSSFIPHDELVKCGICEVVYRGKKDVESHLQSHVKENACQYVFSCPECGEAQENKLGVRKHLLAKHPDVYRQHEVFITMTDEASSGENKSDAVTALNSSRVECLLCHCSFLNRNGYIHHMSRSHVSHKYPCGVCHITAINRTEMISHGKDHLRKNVPLCLLCHNRRIKPPEMLDVHLLYHVEQVRYKTYCPVCDHPLVSFDEALQHLRLEHLLQRQHGGDSRKMKDSSANHELVGTQRLKRSDSSISLEPSLDQNRNISTIDNNAENISYDSRLKTGENSCAKCSFRCSERKEFKMHILSHKDSKSSFQCQECGMCFVVEPSLKMHLKISHRVLDADNYIAKEGTNHTPENESIGLPEAAPSNALECSVCFEVFSTDAQLRTHMRSHGMAFIQAKKTSFT